MLGSCYKKNKLRKIIDIFKWHLGNEWEMFGLGNYPGRSRSFIQV